MLLFALVLKLIILVYILYGTQENAAKDAKRDENKEKTFQRLIIASMLTTDSSLTRSAKTSSLTRSPTLL